MNKLEEIKILTETANKLGSDSYCGPWLHSVIAEIEQAIKADLPPAPLLPHQAARRAQEILGEAHELAARKTNAYEEKMRKEMRAIRESNAAALMRAYRSTEQALTELERARASNAWIAE